MRQVYTGKVYLRWLVSSHSFPLPIVSTPRPVSRKRTRTNAPRAGMDIFCMRALLNGCRRLAIDVAVYVCVVYACCARTMARTKMMRWRHPDDEYERNARRPLQRKRAVLTSSSSSKARLASSATSVVSSPASPPSDPDCNAVPAFQLPATTAEMALAHVTCKTSPKPEQREFVSWKGFTEYLNLYMTKTHQVWCVCSPWRYRLSLTCVCA